MFTLKAKSLLNMLVQLCILFGVALAIPVAKGEPVLFADPGWGAPGSKISVRGTGFPWTDGEVELYLGLIFTGTFDVNSEGEFSGAFTVPAIDSGWYELRAVQYDFEVEVSIPFKVGIVAVVLSETLGSVGSEIRLAGIGFSSGGKWSAYFEGIRIFDDMPVEEDETIAGQFVVPSESLGEHIIAVLDQESGIVVEVSYTITGLPWIELDPTEVTPGQTFVVHGVDFARMKDVRIELYIEEPRVELDDIWTTAEGEFQTALVAPDLPEGRYTLVAEDLQHSISASALLFIQPPPLEDITISMRASSTSILTLDETTISIRVTADGAPLTGASVTLEMDPLMGSLKPTWLETGEIGTAVTVFVSSTRMGEARITGIVSYKGLEYEDTLVIRIANRPPEADILSIQPSPVAVGQRVSFAGQGSDRDNEIESYAWFSNIDGHLGDGQEITIDGLSEGLHMITFQVWDTEGGAGEDSQLLRVEAPDLTGPVISAISHSPDKPSMNQKVEVTCIVEDESGVESVTLLCGVGDRREPVPMTLVGGTWTARIRGHRPGAEVCYMIEAVDGADNTDQSELESYRVKRFFGVFPPTLLELVATTTVAAAVYTANEFLPRPEPAEPKEKPHKRDDQEFSWLVITPRSIHPGGKSLAYILIRNSGSTPVDGLEVNVRGPSDAIIAPRTLKKGLNVGRYCNRFVLIGFTRGARGSKDFTFELSKAGQPVDTVERSIKIKELRVGLLRDRDNSDYLEKIGQSIPTPDPIEEWLRDKGFDYERITGAGDFGALKRFNIIVAPSQIALRDAAVANIRKYVRKGGGLVALDAFGSIDHTVFEEGKPPTGGESRAIGLLGYSDPDSASIHQGYKGLRILDGGHRVTRGYVEGSDVSLVLQEGMVFTSGIAKSRMLASQRVMLEEGGGYIDVAGLVARRHWKGRVVHFNFRVEEIVKIVSHLLEKSVNWAAKFE